MFLVHDPDLSIPHLLCDLWARTIGLIPIEGAGSSKSIVGIGLMTWSLVGVNVSWLDAPTESYRANALSKSTGDATHLPDF